MKKLLLSLILPLFLAPLALGAAAGLSSITFTTSQAKFAAGDSITIREVLASSSALAPGDTVVVRGDYTLQSSDAAILSISLTVSAPGGSSSSPMPSKRITAGTGTFELEYSIQQAGSLHLSFYPVAGGSSFGTIYFASSSTGAPPNSGPTTPPVTPPISTVGLTSVPFTTAKAQFAAGDAITIQEVIASSPQLEPGDSVVVRGQYTLQSRSQALLMVSLTTNAPGALEPVSPTARKTVNAGTGAFELAYQITQPGALHVTFYPSGGGSSFGGVYFYPTAANRPVAASVAIESPVANTGKLNNMSVRTLVGPGAGALVAGLTVSEQDRYVLIRGVGPSLAALGVTGTLSKPTLMVYTMSGELIATAGSWSSTFTGDRRTGIQMLSQSVGAFPLTSGSDDAVLNLRLPPGGYTVMLATGDGQSGTALLEVYTSGTYTLPMQP